MKIKGFTLLECLIALLVFSLFFLSVPPLIQQSRQVGEIVFGRAEQEWHVFLIQMENKLAEGVFVSVEKEKFHFQKPIEETTRFSNGQIEFRRSDQLIVIRDNGGYEPVLMEVEDVTFSKQGQNVYFEIIFKNGEKRNGKWAIPQI
ncbi:competence type IV pilus minor pilin ComGF [Enterococcus olivae]